jgi:hypothetical protein
MTIVFFVERLRDGLGGAAALVEGGGTLRSGWAFLPQGEVPPHSKVSNSKSGGEWAELRGLLAVKVWKIFF